jgi:uncharacterized membrane protein HdeD (DUF308 family)
MNDSLVRSWWVFALRGVLAIMFGVLAVLWPDLTLVALVALFAAYALLSGTVAVIGAVRNRKRDDNWWLLLILGMVSIGAGVIAVIHPALTALVLVLVMGANALVTGVLDIIAAVRLRKTIRGEWLLVLSGALSIAFGVLVFLYPGAGALALVWLVSFYAVLAGAMWLTLAARLRTRARATAMSSERRVNPDRRGAPAHAHP